MNRTWQLRGFTACLALAWLVAACARAANTLEEEEEAPDTGGTAGSTGGGSGGGGGGKVNPGKGGSPSGAFGGTSSSSGGRINAFGGTNAKGGSSSGAGAGRGGASDGGTAGSAASASAGGGGIGGVGGGGTTVPPDVLARASAVVYYQTSHTMASDGTIQMKLHLVNQGPDPLPVANLALRYWFTAEATPQLHQYYHGAAYADDSASFVDAGDRSHVLMTFTGTGTLTQGQDRNSSEVQLEITNNTAKFDQSNDHSWAPGSTTSQPNQNLTLYLDDQLIWGCEPGGTCAP